MAINRNNILKKKRFWAGVLLAQFLLFFLLSKLAIAIQLFESFFEFQKGLHQKLFSWTSISIGDIFYVILVIVLIVLAARFFIKNRRSKASLQLLVLLNILYCTYQIFWGMLYFQQPLIEKLPQEEPGVEETKALARIYLQKCIESRNLVNEDENGVFKVTNLNSIKEEILKNQNRLPELFLIKSRTGTNSLKPSLFGKIMSYTGILGYYNPFTAEAQYDANLPSTSVPFTLAHESTHQLGFAREQEANFVGYLIGRNSDNIDLKYSTEYFVLRYLLFTLEQKHPDFVKEIMDKYSPGMKRDREFDLVFREKHAGLLDVFFRFTNDLFLKTNQQEGSITYSYFTDLLIRYERTISHKLPQKRIASHDAILKTQMMKKNLLPQQGRMPS